MQSLLLLTQIASFRIIVKLFDIQIDGIDKVEFIGFFVPCQAVAYADILLNWNELFTFGVTVQCAQSLLKNVMNEFWWGKKEEVVN